ncbi:hypothetical protein PsorP6_011947 [Peronosclerospora sorghi]|uniref:Uncharacterized protein n=1 Tax=Peronosclerospora sorghi TaxID=230839 RepID=A0ACC0WJL7_9STRA|nr:hypothetical protein PsorP6_011947 [Peronosclerospora sorghi]
MLIGPNGLSDLRKAVIDTGGLYGRYYQEVDYCVTHTFVDGAFVVRTYDLRVGPRFREQIDRTDSGYTHANWSNSMLDAADHPWCDSCARSRCPFVLAGCLAS